MSQSRKALFVILTVLVLTGALFAITFRRGKGYGMMYPAQTSTVAMDAYRGEVAMGAPMDVVYQKGVAISSMPVPPMGGTTRGGDLYLQDTMLSLVSRDPVGAEQKIREVTTELGGFLVSSTLSRPEEGSTATVIVRVPAEKLDEALRRFEETSERTITKSVQGQDVTEQYQDIEAKLATLTKTQARLEELLDRTTDASALLQIQQQLLQLQDQKDYLEGQRRYLAEAAKMTKVTLYIASDELALPYVPAQPWRPQAIFKQAVRSLVSSLRGVGTLLIWGVVFLPLALPFLALAWWLARHMNKR